MSSNETPAESRARQMAEIVNDHERERAVAVLDRYRPVLVAEFGAAAVERVLDDPGFLILLAEVTGARDVEPDEVAYAAVAHLRDHPEASLEDAVSSAAQDED
ncbi:hypothetical protein [Streptomyces niveus]|uniref:hypothetical protein n=1 Tax=Streptomyces niveus TaxID=193462 RepID=UPI0036757296